MSVQLPAPAGERWILTFATPDPASLAVASRLIVPLMYWPGSVIDTVGAVLSTYAQEYGDVVSLQRSLQLFIPVGEAWNFSDATPEPPVSVDVPSKVFVPPSGEPGFVMVAVGAVLSTRRFVAVEELVELPAVSVATARRSY